jgi:hypothetical protein
MNKSDILILKTPILKRLFIVAIGVIFFAVGVLLTFTEDYVVGYVIAIFFLIATVVIARRTRIVLTADRTGLTVYGSTKIPWAEVKSMDVVIQKVGGGEQQYLGISLVNPDYLTINSITQGVLSMASQSIVGKTMSDGSKAQIYVLKSDLPGKSIQESIEVISTFKERVSVII